MLDHQLRTLVFTAMQNAVDNGHTFTGWTDVAVAEDLVEYDSDLEGYDPEDLARYVKEFVWKPEVDKIASFVEQDNLKEACDRVNMFAADIQSHIYSHLPTSIALELAEYDRTNEDYE